MKKDWLITFKEKGKTYMQCKKCNDYVVVSEDTTSVVCGTCNAIKIPWPKIIKQYASTGRPPGWTFMKEFVDKDGTVYHKGVEQPKLKGTLESTKVKPPKKKVKRRTKDEILVAKHKEKLAAQRKIKKELDRQKKFLMGDVEK